VFILGTMTRAPDPKLGGYRESSEGWVLRPPREGRMLISTDPLEDRHRRRVAIWRNLALVSLGMLLLWHGLVFGRIHALRHSARPVIATAVKKETWRRWVVPSKGQPHWENYYRVVAEAPNGERLSAEIDGSSYLAFEVGAGIAFLIADGPQGAVQVGARPCATRGAFLLGLFIAIGWCLLFLMWAMTTQPWWERYRLIEGGSGRL
jgi:hypothetical protein